MIHSHGKHLHPRHRHSRHLQIVLIGQPNCGKSTLFNDVAGYCSVTANFPGASVTFTKSHVRIFNQVYNVIDLPGTYSLTSMDPAAREAQRYLLTQPIDVIVNVVDGSLLSRSLELTLQLMDLNIPMVLCLNMMDEAERKGIETNTEALEDQLGIPVFKTVASHGIGVKELFRETIKTANSKKAGRHIRGNRDVELVIGRLSRFLKQSLHRSFPYSRHLLATKLLENDRFFEDQIRELQPELIEKIKSFRKELSRTHGRSSDEVINAERHALSMSIFEKVTTFKKPKLHWKDRLDAVLMHNVWGYAFLFTVLFGFFTLVFKVGVYIEKPLLSLFTSLGAAMINRMDPAAIYTVLLKSILDGIGGGIAIVLPYLLPFLFGLSFLEDIGYLPRVAFLMDAFMHRIGLHGTAVIPAVLGYGCNVPAVMATRILDSPRDRFIASLISTMVPCAARMTIIFGLVGYYMGGVAAFSIYLLNLVMIALSGGLVSKLLPESTPGMMMEIPAYQLPQLKVTLTKTWLRMREFVVIAWPLLIIGSAVLALSDYFHLTGFLNWVISPVTLLLGLPIEVGTTLIFGLLRKELSMLMLFQALGTQDVSSVMSQGQILVFTIFVVFYVPCVATVGVLFKQVKGKATWAILIYTFLLALILGLLTRAVASLIW
jgi:ferrous iron transport protein B